MLQEIHTPVHEIFLFGHLAYNFDSVLKFGNRQLISKEGAQQGDPLGPLMFSLTFHHELKSLNCIFIIGYMDDVSSCGLRNIVANDFSTVITEGTDIGLYLNKDKCKIKTKTATFINSLPIDQCMLFSANDASLFGSPSVIGTAMKAILNKKLTELKRATGLLQLIFSHDVLALLKASCSEPKLMH